jgi:hydroxyacyl-ACP dehydratase HTD2-like protein with hotdog domain
MFVTVRNEYRQRGRACVIEEQDIVHRSGRSGGQRPTAVDTTPTVLSDEPWQLGLQPNPAIQFRTVQIQRPDAALRIATHREQRHATAEVTFA